MNGLTLSVRGSKLVRDIGARTVGELAQTTADELLAARCFGQTSLSEIQQALAERGLKLGMSAAELQGREEANEVIILGGSNPAEPDQPCCGHCKKSAQKTRQRIQAP